MIAEQLKKSILQAAIQGKLTQQLPEDGEARDLLKDIQKEKARLIKEGKIKKEKPLPEITEDEIPFEIPENWCWCRLRELGITQTGNTPSKTHIEYYGDFIPFVTPGEILNGVINYPNKGLSEKGKNAGRVSGKKSILQVCIGGSIGKCAVNTKETAYNQQINAITPILADYFYVFYFMNSHIFISQMKNKSTGTATPIINKSTWESLVVSVPPIKEQKRIVNSVNQFFYEIDQLKNDETKLEELQKSFPKKMKDAILQYAIHGKLTQQLPEDGDARDLLKEIQKEKARLIKEGKIKKEKPLPEITEDEIPFEIPENWCWVRLGVLGSVINGDRGKNYPGKEHWTKTGIPFINAGCLEEKYLSDKYFNYIPEFRYQMLNSGFIEKGDILYCLRGSLGKMSINAIYNEGAVASSLSIIRIHNIEMVEYVYIVLSSKYGEDLIQLVNNGTAQPNLSAKNVENYIIPVPPLRELQRIVEKLDAIMPKINKLVV